MAIAAAAYGGFELVKGTTGNFGEDAATAAREGSAAQQEELDRAIAELRAGNTGAQQSLDPYAQAGQGALDMQQALLGTLGPEAQQQAFAQIENSPMFQGLLQQGETSLLQNASATGNIRGGNTQVALAQFRPQLLNQLIAQQYAGLAGLSGQGQSAASKQAGFAQQTGANVASVFGDRGAARAGGIIGETQNRLAGRQQAVQMGTDLVGTGAKLGISAAGLV